MVYKDYCTVFDLEPLHVLQSWIQEVNPSKPGRKGFLYTSSRSLLQRHNWVVLFYSQGRMRFTQIVTGLYPVRLPYTANYTNIVLLGP